MASAPVLDKAPAPHPLANRPSIVSVGTVVWLSSELMFFAALFAMFYTIRSINIDNWPPVTGDPAGSEIGPVHLHVLFALFFTVILVLSSVTCQLGVFAAERGDVYGLRRWYMVSLLMGMVFVGGQAWEYFHENEFTLASHAYGSVYYLTTGFHGMHVIGGLVAFVMVLARSTYGRFTPEKATTAIVVSYYWHFVDVVWIGLYATIYLLQ